LKLVAWGLTLAAWSFNGLVLDACSLKLSSLSSHLRVVFGVFEFKGHFSKEAGRV
jgi:hypothetical protein